jgi:TRAP-type mannitol/chloroaromatic compound transport system substrate-binding protein
MDRRFLLQRGGIVGVLAAGAAPAVHAQALTRWRLASSFARSQDLLFGAAEMFAGKVGEMSGGRFQIDVHAAGELMSPTGVLDGVQRGAIEACHTAGSFFFGKNEAFAFGAAIPFGMNARQLAAWMTEGNGLALTREVHAGFNALNFPCGSAGAQRLGWFTREIGGLADIKGLKFRVDGLGGRVLERLGGVAEGPAAGGDLRQAFAKGVIAGAEGTSPYDDLKLGLNKVAAHCRTPAWWAGAVQLDLLANQKAFDALSGEYKAIVQAACAAVQAELLARYDLRNAQALRQLASSGTRVAALPRPVLEAAFRAAQDIGRELDASNPAWKKIHADYRAFQKEQLYASRATEAPYDALMQSLRL